MSQSHDLQKEIFLFQYILFAMIVKVLLKVHVSNYHQKTQIVLVTFYDLRKTIQWLFFTNDPLHIK